MTACSSPLTTDLISAVGLLVFLSDREDLLPEHLRAECRADAERLRRWIQETFHFGGITRDVQESAPGGEL